MHGKFNGIIVSYQSHSNTIELTVHLDFLSVNTFDLNCEIWIGFALFDMCANLVILQYLDSPFTWDKVFKVLRPLPNRVKNQKLLVHILYYTLFNYLGEISKLH